MSFADPWIEQDRQANHLPSETTAVAASLEFEDNFIPQQLPPLNPREPQDNRLPDSENYLATLEKRLNRVKTNPTVLQQLVERREAFMQSLLGGSTTLRSEADLELEEPVNNIELLRFIRPEQALSQAEIVQLVQHDQLQLEADECDEGREGEESGTESSTSR